MDRPRDLGVWQGESSQIGIERAPTDSSVALAPFEPALPASGHSVPETREQTAVARQAAAGAVSPDHAGKMPALIPKRHVPMLSAPVPDRLDGPLEARLGGELPHDPAPFARPAPETDEAEKGEPVRLSMSIGPWPEVHVPRLGRAERQPTFRKKCNQGSERVPSRSTLQGFGLMKRDLHLDKTKHLTKSLPRQGDV